MKLVIRDPGSAITHYIGMILAMFAAMPLLAKAGMTGSKVAVVSMMVFAISMVGLYAASAAYHSVSVRESIIKIFKKIDHMMIYVLIAGSYTPVCLIVLGGAAGYKLLAAVWGIAIIGMIITLFWVHCPKWFSSIIYIAMGWVCVFVFGELLSKLPTAAFIWLLVGGLLYTIGGVIYALKFPIFNSKYPNFGSHEVFHIFVMLGSACHFVFMFFYVI